MQKVTTLKRVQVIQTWVFNKIDRVCFKVQSSNNVDKYNTCFDRGHGSCTCPAYGECYHLKQLRPRYEAIKAKREAEKRAAFVAEYDPCMVA